MKALDSVACKKFDEGTIKNSMKWNVSYKNSNTDILLYIRA